MVINMINVTGMEAALRGMRNPMNSWSKSNEKADIELGAKLAAAGPTHGKFLRMITVTCDITAPLYWWKEFDTYKVGTVANSCSTMHTLMNKPFEISDFETDDIYLLFMKEDIINTLNSLRAHYFEYRQSGDEEKAKKYWRTIIAMLPSAYLQKRTVMLNYEVLRRIVKDRSGHKLKEWKHFIEAMSSLPYYTEFILGKTGEECLEENANAYKEVFNTIPIITKSITNPNKWGTELVACLTGMADDAKNIANEFADSLRSNNRLEVVEPSETPVTKNDPINPSHYKDHCSIECIEAMEIAFGGWETGYFCLGNAFKYLWRHKHKNGQEDLEKSIWYLDKAEKLGADPEKINDIRGFVEKYMKEEEK